MPVPIPGSEFCRINLVHDGRLDYTSPGIERNSTFGETLMSDAAESSAEEAKASDRYELSDLFSDENEDCLLYTSPSPRD